MTRTHKIALVIAATLTLLVGLALFQAARQAASHPDKGALNAAGIILLPQSRAWPNLPLLDQHGEVLPVSRLQGKWTLVFFGYTFCPDICPTTLAELRQLLGSLPAEQRQQVLHQAGEKQIEGLRAAYARARIEGDLRPFIEDMATAYAEADLVICRAGALTVAELAVVGAASLLVPFPHAVDDHQTGNARFLAERGGAYLLPQTELNAERLAGILASIDRPRLLQMAEHARALARPLAAAEVARVCEQLAGGDKT